MALGGPRADLRREQGPHGRAGRGLGGQQVDAAPAPPLLVARHRVEDGLLDLLWRGAGLDHAAGPGQDLGIVNLAGLACAVLHERRLRQTRTYSWLRRSPEQQGLDVHRRCATAFERVADLSGVAEPDETIRPDTDACPGARRPVHVVLGKVTGGSLVGHPNHDER